MKKKDYKPTKKNKGLLKNYLDRDWETRAFTHI